MKNKNIIRGGIKMESILRTKIEELEELLTVEIINTAGGISDDEIEALIDLKQTIRRSLKITAGREELRDVKKIFEQNKRLKELDKPLNFKK